MNHQTSAAAARILAELQGYLDETLLPFWMDRAPDRQDGGFLTHFDAQGRATGVTEKTLLMQVRMVYSLSRAHRAGLGGGTCVDLARSGVDFLVEHYLDPVHGGWFWSADRHGSPTDTRKIGYGQCLAMYAFGEYFQASGDPRGRELMLETYTTVRERMADATHGGYLEIMQRDWSLAEGPRSGGDRKSFDVHMHMMEALTKVVEISSDPHHRDALTQVIELLTGPMLDPTTGLPRQQFTHAFQALPAIEFDVAWGRNEGRMREPTPLDITSYGHNVEFAWLVLEAASALGVPHRQYADLVERFCDHCVECGIDPQLGGVYIEGPMLGNGSDAPLIAGHKQFWQQAEVLVGMLAAFELLGHDRYWQGFVAVHDFVFAHFVHHPGGGEWFALLERDGTPLWDYLGDHYKISYHTVRAMIEVAERLQRLIAVP